MDTVNEGARMLTVLLASPLIIVCAHAVLSRLSGRGPRQVLAFKAALCGYFPTALLLWIFVFPTGPHGCATMILYCFIVYSSLAYTYFHFFNMSETARRIRILYEIYQAGSLSSAEMESLYKTSDIISLRLERLVWTGQLKYEDGHYSLDGKMLLWAAFLVLGWRRLLGLEDD